MDSITRKFLNRPPEIEIRRPETDNNKKEIAAKNNSDAAKSFLNNKIGSESTKSINAEVKANSGEKKFTPAEYADLEIRPDSEFKKLNTPSPESNISSGAAKSKVVNSNPPLNTQHALNTQPVLNNQPALSTQPTANTQPSKAKNQAAKNNYPAPPLDNFSSAGFTFQSSDYKNNFRNINPQGKSLAKQYKLSENEAAAISAYTGDYYLKINGQLRNLPDPSVNIYDPKTLKDSGVNPDLADLISNLVNGLKKLPPAQTDDKSGRGIGRDVNLPIKELKKYKQDAIVSQSMFISTTSTLEQLVDNNWWDRNPQTIVMHQRANGNGREISAFSKFTHESEILFLPNTKFKVMFIGDIEAGGAVKMGSSASAYNDPSGPKLKKKLIRLQEVPSESEQLAATKAAAAKEKTKSNETSSSFKFSAKNF